MNIEKTVLLMPAWRYDSIVCFRLLADLEQHKKWCDSLYKHALWDSFYYYIFEPLDIVHCHCGNDWKLAKDLIGFCFYNEEEALKIYNYLSWFEDNFEEEEPDRYYIKHPDWPKVISRAEEIIDMMEENNKKYNFQKNLEEWDESWIKGVNLPF